MAKSKADQELVKQARDFFRLSAEADAKDRRDRIDDVKFVRLGQQWPEYAIRDRTQPGRERPMLTINRLQQFRNQVINQIRQNQPSGKVRPFDDKADVETAEVYEGLIRHIQDVSRADIAYDSAIEWAVDTGLGWFRIVTGYIDDNSFDQEILIKAIPDAMRVYGDPNSMEPDGSDQRQAIVAEDIPKAEFERLYPNVDTKSWAQQSVGNTDGWIREDTIRIAEYFYLETKKRTLALLPDGSTYYVDEMPPGTESLVEKTRQVDSTVCRWCKIAGDQVVEQTELPTTYIPIIPVIGNVTWLDGRKHHWGLIRYGKDPAMTYNFWLSAETEMLALAPRAPFIAPEGSFEGHEDKWGSANDISYAFLEYKPVTMGGMVLPKPERQPFAGPPTGVLQAKMQAVDDMKASMGIYDASLGQQGNEQSGKAIIKRQQQAEIGNFHFSDNLARSIKHAMRIIIEMIPKIYDTQRVIRVLGRDGTQSTVNIQPGMGKPMIETVTEDGKPIKYYDLSIGRYDLVVDVGPSYATARQEAADQMSQMAQAYPPLMQLAGDLVVKNFDWPGADDIAERLQASLPPNLQPKQEGSEEMSPELMQAQQQMAQMAQQMEHMGQMLQELQDQAELKKRELDIKEMEARSRIASSGGGDGESFSAFIEEKKLHLEQDRIELDRLIADREFQLELMKLGMTAKQADAEEERIEKEEESEMESDELNDEQPHSDRV